MHPAAQKALQFDKATAGMNIDCMQSQLQSNIDVLYGQDRIVTGANYVLVAGEVDPDGSSLTCYQAAVIKVDHCGAIPAMQGPIEPTLYAAYRGLFRRTMQDIGKYLQQANLRNSEDRHRPRTVSQEIDRMSTAKSFRVLGIDK